MSKIPFQTRAVVRAIVRNRTNIVLNSSISMDRRVARSDKVPIEAMRSFLVSNTWDAVSLQIICAYAEISRSKFYTHVRDKDVALQDGKCA